MRCSRVRTAALLGAFLLAGCEAAVIGPEPLEELPRPLTVAERAVIASSNQFAFGLLREADREVGAENLFLSPLSASLALGMTMNGARGETFEAMRATLDFGSLSQHDINASYRSVIDLLRRLDPQVRMEIANSIWHRNTFPFHAAFFDTTRTYFDAEVAALDFDSPASVKRVNDWVEKATSGKIDSILDRIDAEDVMYLINAIYFKGSWTNRFDPSRTQDAPFHDASGTRSTRTVKMMRRDGPILYYRGTDLEAADLPYGNGAYSMTVLLPNRGSDVSATLGSLDPARWSAIVDGLAQSSMGIALPKFRLEHEQGLNDVLTALGMGRAFGYDGPADFNGMSPRGSDLVITKVLQKTYVDVDEEGTEAAAVTNVGVGVTSLPATFTVDRPFVFVIRERFSGTILFVGKVVKP
jgi:serine protease inhibitor